MGVQSMSSNDSIEEQGSVTGVSFKRCSDSWPMSGPEELPSVGDPVEETPPQPHRHRYYHSLKTMIPFRTASGSHPLYDAGFLSFVSFAWMTPMMWKLFKGRLDRSSLFLSPNDGANINGERSVPLHPTPPPQN